MIGTSSDTRDGKGAPTVLISQLDHGIVVRRVIQADPVYLRVALTPFTASKPSKYIACSDSCVAVNLTEINCANKEGLNVAGASGRPIDQAIEAVSASDATLIPLPGRRIPVGGISRLSTYFLSSFRSNPVSGLFVLYLDPGGCISEVLISQQAPQRMTLPDVRDLLMLKNEPGFFLFIYNNSDRMNIVSPDDVLLLAIMLDVLVKSGTNSALRVVNQIDSQQVEYYDVAPHS